MAFVNILMILFILFLSYSRASYVMSSSYKCKIFYLLLSFAGTYYLYYYLYYLSCNSIIILLVSIFLSYFINLMHILFIFIAFTFRINKFLPVTKASSMPGHY